MNRTQLLIGLTATLGAVALLLGTPGAAPAKTLGGPTTLDTGALSMTTGLSHPYVLSEGQELYATVELEGARLPERPRMPVNLALILDRSGSMSGPKLAQAKEAARALVRQLGPADRLALIHYASDVRTVPSQPMTASARRMLLSAIDSIADGGGTNISAGLQSAADALAASRSGFEVSRAILLSDGQATEGITQTPQLIAQARTLRAQGFSLSAIGVGTDFNENLMQGLAELGAGSYAYLRDASQLRELFRRDLDRAGSTVARSVSLELSLPAGVELVDVLGYTVERHGRTVRIPLPDFFSGQTERLVAHLRIAPGVDARTLDVLGVGLSYRDVVAERQARGESRLTARVTRSRETVRERQDARVTVDAARARSGLNVERAAELLGSGDRVGAAALMEENEAVFAEAAVVAGPSAVAADLGAQRQLKKEMSQARSQDDVAHQVKASKAAARKSYGKVDSTY